MRDSGSSDDSGDPSELITGAERGQGKSKSFKEEGAFLGGMEETLSRNTNDVHSMDLTGFFDAETAPDYKSWDS